MKTALLACSGFVSCCLITAPAQAAIISFTGNGQILSSAPKSVVNSSKAGGYFNNKLMTGFNEQQNVLLNKDLKVDNLAIGQTGKKTAKMTSLNSSIAAGTKINSHMIFLNQKDGQTGLLQAQATWKFDGKILGVMSDVDGLLIGASDQQLGATGTNYGASFKNRGMETNDIYSFLGNNELKVNMNITQPGDWIRVITAAPTQSASTPEPTMMAGLLAAGALGARLRKRAQR